MSKSFTNTCGTPLIVVDIKRMMNTGKPPQEK
jgi:hypothetical protein